MADILFVGYQNPDQKKFMTDIRRYGDAVGHEFVILRSRTLNNVKINKKKIDRKAKGYADCLTWYDARGVCRFSTEFLKKKHEHRFPSLR